MLSIIRNRILILVFLFFATIHVFSQKTSVTFRSDAEVSVRIKKPIDESYNLFLVSDKLDLKPNISINYKLDVSSFCSVRCELSNGHSYNILLQKGDNLEMSISNGEIYFNGNNAAGNAYLYNNYGKKGTGFIFQTKILPVFKQYITDKIDFINIDKKIQDSVITLYFNDLKNMLNKGDISQHFADIMTKCLQHTYNDILYSAYQKILWGEINNYKPSFSDSIEILKKIDMLCQPDVKSENPLKYYSCVYLGDYYRLKYKTLNKEFKEKFIDKYDKDIFGSCIHLLLAPDYIQPILLGETFVYQLQTCNTYFNHSKMLEYLTHNFPNSEYLPIINEMIKMQNKKQLKGNDTLRTTFIDNDKANSLKEITQIKEIKGKRVYIDLWSIYCAPCKIQFQYQDDLHKLLSQYDNLASLYISIDNEKDEATWKNQVKHYQLSGFHLRASKTLVHELSQKLYNGKSCYIPRYILLDSDGEIMSNNLPRPQALEKLKKEFSKNLGKSRN